MRSSRRLSVLPLLAGGFVLLLGCSKRGQSVGDFTPSTDSARKALETALNHWKDGNPPGSFQDGTPKIEAVDSKWKAAPKQLKGFEIIGEDSRGDDAAPRYFKVRLTLTSGVPQEVRYVVMGIDPLWVYREQDYDDIWGSRDPKSDSRSWMDCGDTVSRAVVRSGVRRAGSATKISSRRRTPRERHSRRTSRPGPAESSPRSCRGRILP